jgi:pimeloyl-ACP methyl ester carboxylesterase
MRLLRVAGCVAVVTGATVFVRYRRDVARAEVRLARVDRRTVETRFGSIEYSQRGEGPSVLYVHGVVGGCDAGIPLAQLVVPPGYRIVAPSRFGYLGSPMPEDPSPAAQAGAFAALLDELGITETVVVGFSAGSSSSVQLALRHPDRVSGLVLVAANSPHRKPPPAPPRVLAPLLFSEPVFWFLRVFQPSWLARVAGLPRGYRLNDEEQRVVAETIDTFFPFSPRVKGTIYDAYVGNQDIANYPFEEISVPTLAVHAKDDPLASYEDARAMVARIPGARFITVEHGGHILAASDKRAVREIADFVAASTSHDR